MLIIRKFIILIGKFLDQIIHAPVKTSDQRLQFLMVIVRKNAFLKISKKVWLLTIEIREIFQNENYLTNQVLLDE